MRRALVPRRDRRRSRSGDDVGDDPVLNQLDLVLEPELALLQSGKLELVAGAFEPHRFDLLVELAVLGAKRIEVGRSIVVVHRLQSYPKHCASSLQIAGGK